MDHSEQLSTLEERKAALRQADPRLTEKQHQEGKLTAHERAAALFDEGSFVEIDALAGDSALLAGYGQVKGRPAFLAAQDITAAGGAMSVSQARKTLKTLDMAGKMGAPVVLALDSGGTRVTEGAAVMAAMADVFAKMARLSGVVPILAVVAGPCVGIAAHYVRLSDISVAVEKSCELLAAPVSVLNAVNGTGFDAQSLGGAAVAAAEGSVSMTAPDEAAAFSLVASLLEMLPSSNAEEAPFVDADDINRLLASPAPAGAELAWAIADEGTAVELYAAYGRGCHTMLSRVGGYTAGILCSEPSADGGRLDAAACDKSARFVRFCDCFSLPVITLVDSQGLAVPRAGGQSWLMGASSRMLAAYAEATTPKLAVIAGNAVGPAYLAMGGKQVADVAYAWPGAFIAPLTVEASVQTFGADELRTKDRASLEAEYAKGADGFLAASRGFVDDVIDPAQTRKYLIAAIEMLLAKQEGQEGKKHGCLPL